MNTITPREQSPYETKLRSIAKDYLRHAKEDHSYIQQDLKEYYAEGVKQPSLARLFLLDERDKYLRTLQAELSADEFESTKQTLVYNAVMADEEGCMSEEFEAFNKKVEELYPETWILRCALIDAKRIVCDHTTRKLPKLVKRLWRNFMPQEFCQRLRESAARHATGIRL